MSADALADTLVDALAGIADACAQEEFATASDLLLAHDRELRHATEAGELDAHALARLLQGVSALQQALGSHQARIGGELAGMARADRAARAYLREMP